MAYTTIDDPSAYFQTDLYTGTGSSLANTFDGNSDMQPDWVWIKERNGAADHALYDSSRGVEKQLESNTTAAETTEATGLTAFGSDGFTVGALAQVNTSSDTYVAWGWKANGGTTSSNTDGGITTTVQTNTDAGFSIVTYAGTGTSNTIGHGLGVAPDMMIVKNRSGAYNWAVYHKDSNSSPEDYYAQLNTEDAFSLATDIFGTSPATSSVIGVKNFNETNASGSNYVAYCFASKQGYSKFGKYVGNGSNTNGTFIYTGFRPAFIIAKRTDEAAHNWFMWDTKRSPFNLVAAVLYPNATSSESTLFEIDILSNGFKHYNNYGSTNASGASYIYMAFAENPFVTSTGIPATAR
jgi:hypothetical protein